MITGVIFKRVGDGRPYPDHGLTSRAWAELPPRQIRLDELVTTKDTLQLDTLLDEDSTFYGDLFAHVVQWRGDLYLEDGLHRALRAALQQRSVLHARVHQAGDAVSGALKSALTLAVLGLLVVVAAIWGWAALTEPFPEDEPVAICENATVTAGTEVRRDQVVVSVFNGSGRSGLAGATIAQLAERGFVAGDVGDSPQPAATTQIWSSDPTNPAVAARPAAVQEGAGRPGRPDRRRRRGRGGREVQDAPAQAGRVGGRRVGRDLLQGHRLRVGAPGARSVPVAVAGGVAQPLGEAAVLRHLAQPVLGGLAQLARGDDEEVVARAQDRTTLRHQHRAAADHQRDRGPLGQPQLPDLDAVHLRRGRDGHLEQVRGDPVEGRRLDVEATRLGAARDAQQPGDPRAGSDR